MGVVWISYILHADGGVYFLICLQASDLQGDGVDGVGEAFVTEGVFLQWAEICTQPLDSENGSLLGHNLLADHEAVWYFHILR